MKSDQVKQPDIKVFVGFLMWYYLKVIKVNPSLFLAHICYTIAQLFLEQSTYWYCCLREKLLPLRPVVLNLSEDSIPPLADSTHSYSSPEKYLLSGFFH